MGIDVSVVIPAYNKGHLLRLTLASFDQQTYDPRRYELIVVDDGSEDATEEIVNSCRMTCRLRYVKQPNAGRSAARNVGVRQANGDVILFSDAEAIPSPDLVAEHMKHHLSTNAAVFGNTFDVITFWDSALSGSLPGFPPATLSSLLQTVIAFSILSDSERQKVEKALRGESVQFVTEEEIRANFSSLEKYSLNKSFHHFDEVLKAYPPTLEGFVVPWFMFVTVNASIRKDVLEEVGMFDESFSGWGLEDVELGYRLCKAGVKFRHEAGAVNYHQLHPVSTKARKSEHARNYRLFCEKHPAFEVYLFWRCTLGELTPNEYNEVVKGYLQIEKNVGNAAVADYLQLCKGFAYQYIDSYGHLQKTFGPLPYV